MAILKSGFTRGARGRQASAGWGRRTAYLSSEHDREKAVLYGSRAMGNFRPGSDIDLTLFGASLTSLELGIIGEELDDLLLPYEIDLSIFQRIENSDLRDHIERVGVAFYRKDMP